jgi:hypothetical protein
MHMSRTPETHIIYPTPHTHTHTHIHTYSERIVAKITGVLPMTSRNLLAEPKISNWPDYEVRYASMSTIALVEGGPVSDTLDDAAFIRFYGDRPGWNEHRAFSIVAAADPQSTCNLYDPNEDLFLTTTLRGAPQDYWGALVQGLGGGWRGLRGVWGGGGSCRTDTLAPALGMRRPRSPTHVITNS